MGMHRWGVRGRPPKPRRISYTIPGPVLYTPAPALTAPPEALCLEADELEALRLVYYEKLTQEEAAERMGISRGTLWRLLESGRRKLVAAVVEQKPLLLQSPGYTCKHTSSR